MLYTRHARIVIHSKQHAPIGGKFVLLLAVHTNSIMCGGCTEKVPGCYIPRVAASTGIHKQFHILKPNNYAQFIVMGMTPSSRYPVGHGEEKYFHFAAAGYGATALRKY